MILTITHRIHGAGIYANIWGILMVNDTIYSIHGSYGILTTSTKSRITIGSLGRSVSAQGGVVSPWSSQGGEMRRCSEMDFVEILSNHRDSTVNIIYIYNNENNKKNIKT